MTQHPCLDPETAEKLTRIGGASFVDEMVELFLNYVPGKLAAARLAEKNGDRIAVQQAVHPIKSSAGNIGAATMLELAARIEQLAGENETTALAPLLNELENAYKEVENYLRKTGREH